MKYFFVYLVAKFNLRNAHFNNRKSYQPIKEVQEKDFKPIKNQSMILKLPTNIKELDQLEERHSPQLCSKQLI
jgi:hypothetical protein